MELIRNLLRGKKMESEQKNKTVKELFERLKKEKTDCEIQEMERDRIMDKFIFILTKN